MFVLLSGDIGYQGTGALPQRQHNVVQGVYAKDATKKENSWIGVIEAAQLPSSINPEKGYIVNANNRVASHLVGDDQYAGASHAFSSEFRAA